MTENTPLDKLAAQAQVLENDGAETGPMPGAAPAADPAQAAQAMQLIEAGMTQVVLAALKLGRAWLAKRLPEIRDEWTDEALSAPAAAAVPLLRQHMERLMQLAGSSPEAAAFAITCLPLAMGVVTAMDRAAEREKKEAEASLKKPGIEVFAHGS
jgi:hypothetical protein